MKELIEKLKKLLTKTMLSDRTDGYINSKGELKYSVRGNKKYRVINKLG